MSYFSKNNVLLWVIIVLLIIVLSAIGTMQINMSRDRKIMERQMKPRFFKNENFLRKELNLNEEQVKKFKAINEKQEGFRKQIMEEMREERHKIDSQLTSGNPDTAGLNEIISRITTLQKEMIKEHIQTYLELKKICNAEQQDKLTERFKQMLMEGPGRGKCMKRQRGEE
jgi:Spy/CpxP family protein refolding chaperone